MAFSEIPPILPFSKGGELLGNSMEDPTLPLCKREAVKKFKSNERKASLVVRGRGKFSPPKPAGDEEPQSIYLTSAERRRQLGNTSTNAKRIFSSGLAS
jgi:hypothetical protein